jgi:hypothetical protein
MSLQSIINNLWDKLQSTFSGVSWSKVLPFFLFLIVAFVFWLLIFFERNTEGNYTIPIKYVNMPKQEVFVDPVPQHIDLRVRDLGSELFRYSFFKKRDSLLIDVAEAQKSNDARLQGNELTQLIRSKLAVNTQLVGYMPASISLKTSKLQSKTVPVVFDGEMRTSAGHLVIDSISIIPSEATVFGTPEQLVNITNIVTEYSVFENLKATSQLSAKIKAIEGVSIEPKEVDIYIPIHEFTERQFEIPISATDKPETINVRFFPSRARVTFSVTLDDYKKIVPEDFEIKISYNSLKQIEGDQVELELSKFPPSIKNPHITPAMVEFLFERK